MKLENFNNTWEFVWGIKSWDDLSDSQANEYTLNDFVIYHNKQTNKYTMSIETIYQFNEVKGEYKYMLNILHNFTQWMQDNNYSTNYSVQLYSIFTEGKNVQSEYDSIEELYAHFKLLVIGFCQEVNI